MRKHISFVFCLTLAACSPNKTGNTDMSPGVSACPTAAGPGTTHSTYITKDETWSAADSPHHVTFGIVVRGGATLTVEPCATVVIDEGHTLTIGENTGAPAKLIALGSADENDLRPIIFKSFDDSKYWGALNIYPTGSADLSAVILHRAGNQGTAPHFGALVIYGDDNRSVPTPSVRARGLLIEEAPGFGISILRAGGFTADSNDVTVSHCGGFPRMGTIDARYPIYVEPPSVQTIPPGSYTGNAVDAILVSGNNFGGDEAFWARGVPYRMKESWNQSPLADNTVNTLTIEAGVTIKMLKAGVNDWSFNLGNGTRAVKLIAAGTADKPIVFTSAAETPAPGDWGGIEWGGGPSTGNVMSFVIVEYAGGNSSTLNFGCGPVDNDSLLLIKNWQPAEPFIQSCTFRHSAASGIVSGWHGAQGDPDLHSGNTFESIANGCLVSVPTPITGGCPGNDTIPDCY